jgi:hypothetical protein
MCSERWKSGTEYIAKMRNTGSPLQLCMESVRRVPRENTAGFSVRITLFITQNKQQQHRSQTNGATELR